MIKINLLNNLTKRGNILTNSFINNSKININIKNTNNYNNINNKCIIPNSISKSTQSNSLFKNLNSDSRLLSFNNASNININKYYSTSKIPPPLTNQVVRKSGKELVSMYILLFVGCSIVCVIYYIAYLNYQRLDKLNKGIEEIENLSDDQIREIIAESKRAKLEKEKENENIKKAPVDRILK
ncbi:hypothetical protein DICPUDRAFT_79217 [Dictyostelium purpureum]|uniref:Uncharacterized protein n=1 Tax=Dictyostelium purpureum TaxID=5786 RepID=F0ZLX3_DICPU|nr:uncharacterized protein DICPUDRAFT_79217 [Dictyostelium purpureum]EGC35041.1 hypothetical protein DICPUDRAFT_79217 [Dictyostelium purpureum]|eukprot:XP_003288409.1 hypothetical protein DICPUDRAFT_79217 [Dictyostelium purpureum]